MMGKIGQKVVNKLTIIFVILSVILMAAVGLVYFYAVRQTESLLKEEMLHRQTVLVRQGAQTLESYFSFLELKLLFISELPAIVSQDRSLLHALLIKSKESIADPVTDLGIADEKGAIIARSSDDPDVGNISNRDYFILAKLPENRGKVIYSPIIIARQGVSEGKHVVNLATAYYDGNQFKGVALMVVSLDKLTEKYVDNLKVSKQSGPVLIDASGLIITSPNVDYKYKQVEEYLGDNLFSDNYDFLYAYKNAKMGVDGKTLVFVKNSDGEVKEMSLAYTPVHLDQGNKIWSLGIFEPTEEALAFFGKFDRVNGLYLGLIVSILLFSTAVCIYIIRVVQRNSYLEGFAACRDRHGEYLKNSNAKKEK